MSRRFLLLVLLLTAGMAACKPTADVGPQTAVPPNTEHRPLNTATPTVAPTATPLPRPIAFDPAFTSGLIRYDPESGQWLVSAVQTVDGGRETVELALLPDSFSTYDDLREHNPLAPYTVRALDQNGQEVTLLWNPDTAEFRVVPNFQELYTGVNTNNPQLNEEALANLPTLTIEDVQSGDAARFILSYILERMDKGESLADILYMDPDAVRQNWHDLGGNSLLFEILPDGTRIANLKAKGNDQSAQDFRYDNAAMKVLPFAVNIEINGQNYLGFYIAIFDPVDPQNPDPNNLSNWKFLLSIPSAVGEYIDIRDSSRDFASWFGENFRQNNPSYPYIVLFATNPDLDPNDPENIVIRLHLNPDDPNSPAVILPRDSIYAQLSSIPGNDARIPRRRDNEFNLQVNINGRIVQLDSQNNIIEVPIPQNDRLPPELQLITPSFENREKPQQ